ncbi:MAG TPA: HAMP domain-containing protein, partial [Caulobacteraceae bacterium]
MNFDDLKLRTKVLIPLIGMAAVFACVIGAGTVKLNELTHRYGLITSAADPAMLLTAKATRTANTVVREAYGLLSYDPTSAWAKQASADFQAGRINGDQAWDEAIRLNPAAADKYKTFRDRFDAIYQAANAPIAIGAAIPALNTGSKLKPAELDQMATALTELEAIDKDVTALMKDVQDYNDPIEAQNAKEVEALKRDAASTIAMMIGLGLLSIVTGLGVSIWIANGKVAGPLVRLGERMKRLASGELSVQIEGQERGDEVGDMAKAVQVFKDNALKTQAMEAEARTLR